METQQQLTQQDQEQQAQGQPQQGQPAPQLQPETAHWKTELSKLELSLMPDDQRLLPYVVKWHNWLQQYLKYAREKQAAMDNAFASINQQLLGAYGSNIPGVSYGAESNKGLTCLLMGSLGTWKTAWCAGWPNPFFLSVTSEGGDDTLIKYPSIAVSMLEASRYAEMPPVFNVLKPRTHPIRSIQEFNQWVGWIAQNHAQWNVSTVVVDSLTYLIDMWVAEHTKDRRSDSGWRAAQKAGKADLMRAPDWGMLNNFLRDTRVVLANCGLNVIYTCLDSPQYETDERDMMKRRLVSIEPMVTGKSKVTLPGACKLIIHAEKAFEQDTRALGRQRVQPVYWTSPSPLVPFLRHRYADSFPAGHLVDPEWGTLPTFRAVYQPLQQFIYLGQQVM